MTLAPKVVRGLKIAYPTFAEISYAKQLSSLSTSLQILIIKQFKSAELESVLEPSWRHDDIVDDLENVIKSINIAISIEVAKVIKSLSDRFISVRKFVDNSFRRSLSHLANYSVRAAVIPVNVPVGAVDIVLLKKMWVEKNTQLIKDIPANCLVKINDAVYEAVRSGESMQGLSKKLEEIFQSTSKRARIIARDQIAKLKSDLSRYNDLTHGLTMYEWSSCKDGAVRESHKALEGKICSWLDSTIYKNTANERWKKRSSIGGVLEHAGADIMCRCTNIILQEVRE